MTQEELKMELEELAVRFSEGWHEGIKIDASDIMLLNEAAQALAQPEQEPVIDKSAAIRIATSLGWTPQRKPLTNEEIWSAIRPLTKSDENCKTLVDVSMDEYRAIEAAHNIKENT